MSDDAAPELMCALFFSRASTFSAKAMPLLLTSVMASTPSRSNHCRATFRPTSALFWWSACRISTLKPLAVPKSCTAWRAAATAPGPVMSR